ncbi:MAG: sulfite exporter TauE/SafE family protein [Candidatus Promineifilaceae bacterium]
METVLAVLFFVIAVLYSAVGLGGGSGYVAVMGAAGLPPDIIRPTALSMNILVSTIATISYLRAGYFTARIFWPVTLASVPMAYLGGYLTLPPFIYRPLVGAVLVYTAWRLWRSTRQGHALPSVRADRPLWLIALAGAVLGLMSGLMGIGGGTFLAPLLLLTGWADTKNALGVTAAFVLFNSLAGLAGRLTAAPALPAGIAFWVAAAGLGGLLGARLGSRRLDPRLLRIILALILLVGGLRLLLNL